MGAPRRLAHLAPLVAALATLATDEWTAAELRLMRSDLGLGPGGAARHEVLARWPLGRPAQLDLLGGPAQPDLLGRLAQPDLLGGPAQPDLLGRPAQPDLLARRPSESGPTT